MERSLQSDSCRKLTLVSDSSSQLLQSSQDKEQLNHLLDHRKMGYCSVNYRKTEYYKDLSIVSE